MLKFEMGDRARVSDDAQGVAERFLGEEGVVSDVVAGPGTFKRGDEWGPTYEVEFPGLGELQILNEDKLIAI